MEKKPLVTVLTPTYNRVHLLETLVQSLCRQSAQDFQWLVVDDGSTDETEQYFAELKKRELPFAWEYHRQENGGKHTALNTAHPYIQGELVLILDSDDYLTDDAIETIETDWPKYSGRDDLCGLNYFKVKPDGTNVSAENPKDFYIANYVDYIINNWIRGDHCEVVRADLLKASLFPVYPGERFMAESWLWNTVAAQHQWVYRNKAIYVCEYLEGGLTKSGRALRMKCPYGMMDDCRKYFTNRVCATVRLKEMLLYWVYAHCAGYSFTKTMETSGRPAGMALMALPGALLYSYWKKKYLGEKK